MEGEEWRDPVAAPAATAAASDAPVPPIVDVDVRTGQSVDRPVSPAPPSAEATTLHVVKGGAASGGGRGGGSDWVPKDADGRWREFTLDDQGNAERLIHWHGRDLRWCEQWKSWLVWDGSRWKRDKTGGKAVIAMAVEVVNGILKEVAWDGFKGDRSAYFKHWSKSRSEPRLKAMVSLAASVPGVVMDIDDFDQNREILPCRNGTIELRTGTFRECRREDYCTKRVHVDFDPEAKTELWIPFLEWAMGGDTEMMEFIGRAVGYSLTGLVDEERFFFLYGRGRNGKGVFSETLSFVLGDYTVNSNAETFMMRQASAIQSDIARLAGSRFVTAPETPKGGRLNETLVKNITGGDQVTARPLYAPEVQFLPQLKLWISGNYQPKITGTDEGIWSRVIYIGFTQFRKAGERDKGLKRKLRAEAAGILAWAVAGCREWYKRGLEEPQRVKDDLKAYREDMDVIGRFLEEETETRDDGICEAGRLYEVYKSWAKRHGEYDMGSRDFGVEMKGRGLPWKRRNTGVLYFGFVVRADTILG